MSLSKSPTFNLKAVLQETNLAADTLRAWERRYGLPMPQRTTGGHRLYSQYDIETIKWLMTRQTEGLSISRAVDSWNEKTASGTDPLAGAASQAFPSPSSSETSLDLLRSSWLTACLIYNETKAETILNEAFAAHSIESVCSEVLQRGLAEIGEHWYHDRVSVQQEHFASGLAVRRLNTLISATPPPTRNQTVLIGCPPHELHTFMPLLLSLILRRRGLNTIYLGADVPADRFAETISTAKANLVILISQTLISAAALQHTALSLTDLNIPISFGGRIFNIHPELIGQIPGGYLGSSISDSLDEIEKLLKTKFKTYTLPSAPQEYITAHKAFVSKRTHIESTAKGLTPPLSMTPEELNSAIRFLGDNITAALQLGDMNHVTGEMEWLKVLLQNHQRPEGELKYFMQIYSQSINQHINKHSKPIKTWFNSQTAQDKKQ